MRGSNLTRLFHPNSWNSFTLQHRVQFKTNGKIPHYGVYSIRAPIKYLPIPIYSTPYSIKIRVVQLFKEPLYLSPAKDTFTHWSSNLFLRVRSHIEASIFFLKPYTLVQTLLKNELTLLIRGLIPHYKLLTLGWTLLDAPFQQRMRSHARHFISYLLQEFPSRPNTTQSY